MHYVYLLKSAVDHRLYVGCTDDLKNRFFRHNSGKVKSTKSYRPWILVYYEAYKEKPDATKREVQLKMHAVKNNLMKQIKESLK
ncbi:GIY-YIG nuclease family protein [Candidatus Collierbacteria bacterium]|nr:GIY-YIG nuclease family protein [Candidatus Collierbacteria bacterium]